MATDEWRNSKREFIKLTSEVVVEGRQREEKKTLEMMPVVILVNNINLG